MKQLAAALACWMLSSAVHAEPVVGTVAVYSDGHAEKLIKSTEHTMLWEDARKRRYLRSRLPYLPDLEYRRFPAEAGGYRQTLSSDISVQLIPFGEKTYTAFTMMRSAEGVPDRAGHWNCEYTGLSERSVLGKKQPLHNYACMRYVLHRKIMSQEFRQQEDIAFSPELGVVVKRRSRTRSDSKARTLIALLPPEKATGQRISRLIKSTRKQ